MLLYALGILVIFVLGKLLLNNLIVHLVNLHFCSVSFLLNKVWIKLRIQRKLALVIVALNDVVAGLAGLQGAGQGSAREDCSSH